MTIARNGSAARIRGVLTAALAALAATGIACGEEPEEAAPVTRPVKILALSGSGTIVSLEYPGSISANQESDLGFEVAGKIIEFPIEEGQRVEEGALLAKLDPRDYQSLVQAEEAKLAAARAEYDRAKKLFAADVASEQQVDVKRRNFQVARSGVETSKKALEDTELRAPFEGVVGKKLVIDFANVEAKQPVVHLQDDGLLELVASVPERDLASARDLTPTSITERTKPKVRIASLPDRLFDARLSELSTLADPVTRTYEARFQFDPPDDVNVLPGMTGRVILQVPRDSRALPTGMLIPSRAVSGDETGTSYVWVVDPEAMTVSRRDVQIGPLSGAEVLVESGLEGTEQIAISGVSLLREGMTVRRLAN